MTGVTSCGIRRAASWILALTTLWSAAQPRIGYADPIDTKWHVRPEFYLTGISNFRRQQDASVNYDTLAATAYLTIRSPARSYFGGLVVDYRYSSSERFDDNFNIGGYFRVNLGRWDNTTWVFVNRAPQSADTWLYQARLRYRVGERSKLGIEAIAPIDDAGNPKLMLGYYGTLADSLSLNVMAGAGTAGSPDLTTRIELSWQLH